MEANNNKAEQLFGGLTREQLKQMPSQKRRLFIGTLAPKERHEYFVGAFLGNLNQNAEENTSKNQNP